MRLQSTKGYHKNEKLFLYKILKPNVYLCLDSHKKHLKMNILLKIYEHVSLLLLRIVVYMLYY